MMTEAKGSDVRAACEAAAAQIYHEVVTAAIGAAHARSHTWKWNDFNERSYVHAIDVIIERHLTPVVEARVQAAEVEMRQWCENLVVKLMDGLAKQAGFSEKEKYWKLPNLYGLQTQIRALSVPTDALDAMLLRARIEGAEEAAREVPCGCDAETDENDLCYAHAYILKQKRQLAALTQPAPERKEK